MSDVEQHGADALEFLTMKGLPPRLEWQVLPNSRYQDHFVVDFSILRNPRTVSDMLPTSQACDWFSKVRDWSSFLVIGTWTSSLHSGIGSQDAICVNRLDGALLRVAISPQAIQNALSDAQNLASTSSLLTSETEVIKYASETCATFFNSTAKQMMMCFDSYFAYLDDPAASTEEFLREIASIDDVASEPGTVWYLLVADYLDADY